MTVAGRSDAGQRLRHEGSALRSTLGAVLDLLCAPSCAPWLENNDRKEHEGARRETRS